MRVIVIFELLNFIFVLSLDLLKLYVCVVEKKFAFILFFFQNVDLRLQMLNGSFLDKIYHTRLAISLTEASSDSNFCFNAYQYCCFILLFCLLTSSNFLCSSSMIISRWAMTVLRLSEGEVLFRIVLSLSYKIHPVIIKFYFCQTNRLLMV